MKLNMFIYLIVFIITYLLLIISKKAKKNKKVFEIFSILVPAVFASLRSSSIGTDVSLYVLPVFKSMKYVSLFELGNIWTNIEIGYKLVNYIFYSLFGNTTILLFVIQFMILYFSFLGLKKISKNNYEFIYLLYLIMYFNTSLNLVRQFIAISFCIYALGFLVDGKNNYFFLNVFIAFLFHKTSLIFLIVYIIYKLKKQQAFLFSIILSLFGIICIFSFPSLLNFLIDINLVSSKYLFYLDNFINLTLDFQSFDLLIDIVLLVIACKFSKRFESCDKKYFLYCVLLIVDIIIIIIAGKYTSLYRLGFYFRIPAYFYFFSQFFTVFPKVSRKKIKIILLIFTLFYWMYIIVISNCGNTIPYVSSNGIKLF